MKSGDHADQGCPMNRPVARLCSLTCEDVPTSTAITADPTRAVRGGRWILDLRCWRPFHPTRLLANVDRLAAGPLCSHGHFWLPTRPDVRCAWNGAEGRVGIGAVGSWDASPQTHLVITGTGRDAAEVLTAFDRILLTDAEITEGLPRWAVRDDGLDAWLGERRTVA